MRNSVPLIQLLLFAFIWTGFYAGSYLLLDTLGLWPRLPGVLTHVLDLLTGAVLLLALVGNLILSTGRLPEPPGRDLDSSVTPPLR
jgi:hypothetical protein